MNNATPERTTFADDADRWTAVQRRDATADGAFIYSVASTGVYCRPSCPSRPKRRENVAFHADATAAERAGYRPCRRCRPQGPSLAERRATAVAAACRLIETAEELPDLDALADAAGLSRFHFHRVFKAATGVTPKAYAAMHRAERVRTALAGKSGVTEAIYDAGYNASSRFYAEAGRQLGMAPSAYRDGGRGASVRFAVGDCSLGSILVAATDKGVCAIRSATIRTRSSAISKTVSRRPSLSARTTASKGPSPRSSVSSTAARRRSTCRSTCAGPRSSGGAGTRSPPSRPGGPRATPRSPRRSASPPPCAPWRRLAPPTRSPSPSPATASSDPTAPSPATGGASSANANCSRASGPRSERRAIRQQAARSATGPRVRGSDALRARGRRTMAFRVLGLPADPFRRLYGLSDEALAARGVERLVVDGKPGFPDRVEVRDLEPGETALLLNFVHQPADTPYRASHAIFVREGAEIACDVVDSLPEALRVRPLSLRAFDGRHMMVDADLVEGGEAERVIARFFGDPRVTYVHAHYARRGCYAARIERA